MKRDVRFLHMPAAYSVNPAHVAALRSAPPWPQTARPYFNRAELDRAAAVVRAAPKPYFSKTELDYAAAIVRATPRIAFTKTEEAK